jgi:lysyl hydroxylase/galactosyltransferase/glucosyltransferase/procollagen-lysine,2-oxoglutarate 5-dioxygenase
MIDMSRRVKKCPLFLMSISTKEHPDLDRYKKSAEEHGFKPNILGLHEKKTTGHSTGDFSFKLKYLLEFCKKRKPNDIVIQTDAWDVIVVYDCDNIVKQYKSFKKDIILSGEKFCWPDMIKFYKFNFLSVPFPYINAGLLMGRAGVIREMIEKYWDNGPTDDQRMWIKAYFENRSKIAIDEKAKIFLNMLYTNKEDIVYEDNKLKYKPTKTFPFFVHAQGPDKSYLNHIRY